MSSLHDTLFGPVDTKYCIYFYILSVIGFVFMTLAIVSGIMLLASKNITLGGNYIVLIVSAILSNGMMYFVNRLLYNMCKSSEGNK